METIWFCLVAVMIAMYVVLDGFDLGAGIIHLIAARNAAERRLVLRSIGPVWDGNEVWLLAAGGTLFFAFPKLYASAFSGFYLPLMVVLWLLILRGISIEFRNHLSSAVWTPFWDVVFSVASALLAIFFGIALGNVVRGVPLDSSGYFFSPFWTDFRVGPDAGIIDWYTVIVGLTAFFTLTVHGALWVAMKTGAELSDRSHRLASGTWWALVGFTILVTVTTFRVQPHVPGKLTAYPLGFIFPALALAGLLGVRLYLSRRDDVRAFLSSCAYILGMLASAVFGLYPLVLPASTDSSLSLTIYNAASPDYGLKVGLVWWVIGMALATGYFVFLYRHFTGKVKLEAEGEGY
jgi:cytochrome d ubiquinol oxidase subunit II